MQFQIYQQEKTQKYQKKNKRVIKANRKNVAYTATNFAQNVNEREQGCDYYLGVISSKNPEKLHMVQVQTPYQFTQDIKGFKENYGVAEDNEAIKNMTYMEKKALLVQNFGVYKARRQTASLIANKVDDDGVTNKEGKGARDPSLIQNAQAKEEQQQLSKKKNKK